MASVNEAYDITWQQSGDYTDIRYDISGDGIAKITICRPELHNAFRPQTLIEISDALVTAREDESVGVIILTGQGDKAFCPGGDQRVRGDSGYQTDENATGRFHVTDLHVQMRRTPKPIVAMVAGWAPAAATCCSWSATWPSPRTTPGSARSGRGSDRWTAASAPRC
jgi:naphthoate synthase